MTVWITGGAGFLGRRLTSNFQSSELKVVSLSRRPNHDADQTIQIDLASEPHKLLEIIKRQGPPEVVVHAASKQPGSGTQQDFVRSNVVATSNLLDALKSSPPRQIIYTSTSSVYANTTSLPVAESAPASASSPYGSTKRWAEQLLESFSESQVIVLRLPSLYGVGQADSFIDGLAKTALRNEPIDLFSRGQLIRDALHVTDVIGAIRACIDTSLPNQFYLMNLGCGRAIRTLEYAEVLVEALGSSSPITVSDRPASQFDCYADIQLARRTIGFQPTELRQSMRTYANELRS